MPCRPSPRSLFTVAARPLYAFTPVCVLCILLHFCDASMTISEAWCGPMWVITSAWWLFDSGAGIFILKFDNEWDYFKSIDIGHTWLGAHTRTPPRFLVSRRNFFYAAEAAISFIFIYRRLKRRARWFRLLTAELHEIFSIFIGDDCFSGRSNTPCPRAIWYNARRRVRIGDSVDSFDEFRLRLPVRSISSRLLYMMLRVLIDGLYFRAWHYDEFRRRCSSHARRRGMMSGIAATQ